MPISVNLRHLEAHDIHLEGQIPVAELDIDPRDEVVQLHKPLAYNVDVQMIDGGLLVQGRLCLSLECQCVRCLKNFDYHLELDPWTCHLPLQGEEAVPVVNDCVDLTAIVREDILLEFPQHPLCEQDCRGLSSPSGGQSKTFSNVGLPAAGSPEWKELNKLKF
jgi:uncharacterized metal-binding protein YceD (DUF177 family)